MHRVEIGTFSADRILRVTAQYLPDPGEPISQALASLTYVQDAPLHVRYARMWLREAATASNRRDEVRHLAKAEQELGRAVLASAAPDPKLSRAFQLTMEARRNATD